MSQRWFMVAAISVGIVTAGAASVRGQNSSLFQRDLPANSPPIMLDKASFSFVPPPPPPKELRKHDKIGIRVDLKSRVMSDGQIQRRKTANLDALLSDWIIFRGLTEVKPAPQTEGDQRISGQITQQFRALGELTASESMKYEIAGEVADIRPNGLLGHHHRDPHRGHGGDDKAAPKRGQIGRAHHHGAQLLQASRTTPA